MGNFVQQRKAGVCSPLFQCSPIQYFQHLINACFLFVYPKCPSSCPSLDHLYVAGTIVFNSFLWVPFGAAVLKLWTEYCCALVYAFALRDGDLTLKFRVRKPRVLFDFAVVLPMWVFHLRSCEMCTPRYFVLCADLIGTPWSVYSCMIGCFVRLTRRTPDLSGLKLINQSCSHSSRLSKSACSSLQLSCESIDEYMTVSSANK